MYRDCQY